MINNLSLHSADIFQHISILYLEDDDDVSSQTVPLLKLYFKKIIHFTSAEDALEYLNTDSVDIIITDIELPGMDGLAFCETIRSKDRNIPIFITTAHDEKKLLQKAIRLNLVDYLIKPISISLIKNTLISSLSRLEENGTMYIPLNHSTTYSVLSGCIKSAKGTILLTHSEITLLNLLIKHKNNIVMRETIEYALERSESLSDSAYKNLIYRLRKKIGKESLSSISGVGLKLNIH